MYIYIYISGAVLRISHILTQSSDSVSTTNIPMSQKLMLREAKLFAQDHTGRWHQDSNWGSPHAHHPAMLSLGCQLQDIDLCLVCSLLHPSFRYSRLSINDSCNLKEASLPSRHQRDEITPRPPLLQVWWPPWNQFAQQVFSVSFILTVTSEAYAPGIPCAKWEPGSRITQIRSGKHSSSADSLMGEA